MELHCKARVMKARSKEKGTLGKGPSQSSGLRTRKKSMAGTFGVLAGFALGDLPVSRAWVFCFSQPFATLLLWLPCGRGKEEASCTTARSKC